jgi:hypothetical protein
MRPRHTFCRGILWSPGTDQRRQATIFRLGGAALSVACFETASGLIRPVISTLFKPQCSHSSDLTYRSQSDVIRHHPNAHACTSAAALLDARGVLFRGFAARQTLRPACHAYSGRRRQRDQASCDGSKAHRSDRDVRLAPNRSRPRQLYVMYTCVESKYSRIVTYAVFFDDEVYKGLRTSVILDNCEKQYYRPVT